MSLDLEKAEIMFKLIRKGKWGGCYDRDEFFKRKNEETYSKQQQFFEKLKKLPDFELVLCRMQKDYIDGNAVYCVKEDDIHIAVDMVKLAYNDAYDTAILVSTDGDFVPAIEAVKERGKKIENVSFEKKFSWHLKQKSDKFRQLSKKRINCFFRIKY